MIFELCFFFWHMSDDDDDDDDDADASAGGEFGGDGDFATHSCCQGNRLWRKRLVRGAVVTP